MTKNFLSSFVFTLIVLSWNVFAHEVPAYMFHFGKQEYLIMDAEIDSVPDYAWDNFIMGGQTRYDLPYPRRGLYGGVKLNYISHYTPNCGEGKENGVPWFMVIHIKEECRSGGAVGDVRDILNNQEFNDWFDQVWLKENPGYFNDSADFFRKGYDSQTRMRSKFYVRYHTYHKLRTSGNRFVLPDDLKGEYLEKLFKLKQFWMIGFNIRVIESWLMTIRNQIIKQLILNGT